MTTPQIWFDFGFPGLKLGLVQSNPVRSGPIRSS